jgi:hypothetical protein
VRERFERKMFAVAVLLAALGAGVLIALVAAAFVATQSSARPAAVQPEGQTGLRGYITEKKDRTILVEEKPCRKDGRIVKYTRCDPERWRGDKGFFEVTRATTILDRSGECVRRATYRDLAVGQTVRATYRGPVQESYPTYGRAGRVVILAEAATPVAR